jgi:Terminase large subunit, T4likevirus-type, N-terminal
MELQQTTSSQSTASPRILSLYRDFGPEHHQILSCQRRFIVLVAGRRWGKTTLGLFMLLSHAASAPGQVCYYIGPTERQAKEMGWRTLMDLIPPELIGRVGRSDLEIELINRSIIKLHGPQSLRGTGLDFVVLDECAYMPATLWPEVVRPMLADREGRALLSSTPRGFNHFYDLYREVQARSDWAVFHYPTARGGFISGAELGLLRSTMDPQLYGQEIEARFELQHGRVYHAFSREQNVTDIAVIPNVTLLVGMDFNINPMTAVVAQNVAGQCHILDEMVLPNSNTFEMMEELVRRYPQRGVVYPDPTGASRKTSASVGLTDHSIIRQSGWRVPYMNPYPVVDRINSVNAILQNANHERRLFIDRRCKNLIRALDGLIYKEGTHLPDKSTGFDHITDALGYLVMAVFPMLRNRVSSEEFLM